MIKYSGALQTRIHITTLYLYYYIRYIQRKYRACIACTFANRRNRLLVSLSLYTWRLKPNYTIADVGGKRWQARAFRLRQKINSNLSFINHESCINKIKIRANPVPSPPPSFVAISVSACCCCCHTAKSLFMRKTFMISGEWGYEG